MPYVLLKEHGGRSLGHCIGEGLLERAYINDSWFLNRDKVFSGKELLDLVSWYTCWTIHLHVAEEVLVCAVWGGCLGGTG